MFNRSLNTTIGFLLFVLLWPSAPVLAQGGPALQQRVTGTCPPGQSIRVINQNGSVVCEVDDNSGGTVTSVGTGSGLTGGPITTTGTISVNPAQVQSRVTGTCPTGSAIQAVDQSGTVTGQSVGNGTVTSISTGSGLTGGPITTSGTIGIATGGVTSAHIADGTVGAVDVNPAEVQLRVSGTCATGSAIRSVDQSGRVTCQSVGGGTVAAVTD